MEKYNNMRQQYHLNTTSGIKIINNTEMCVKITFVSSYHAKYPTEAIEFVKYHIDKSMFFNRQNIKQETLGSDNQLLLTTFECKNYYIVITAEQADDKFICLNAADLVKDVKLQDKFDITVADTVCYNIF
jgi:hypothetical protein